VSATRLRTGELLTLTGGVVVVVALFLPWFAGLPSGASGWRTLGWLVLALALGAVASAAWLVAATVAESGAVTRAVGAAVLAATVGPLAFGALALRALVVQPGPNALAGVRYGAWLGLAGAAMLAVGAWWALRDERTDAPQSAYEPPAPRPAPPPRAS
jgi:uncharacterized membrane protein YebE (DUF533 family)